MKLALLLAAFALVAAPGVATGHAHLHAASPAPDAKDVAAPTRLSLTFSEAITPAFSGAELIDAASHPVKLGKASLGDGGRTLSLPVAGVVKPGGFTVRWHVVSVDTHRMKGEYRFTVKP